MIATVCIFTKAFRPGTVKTRLIPTLGVEGATRLATALFRDTLSAVQRVPWARPVIASTETLPRDLTGGAIAEWPQGSGDLGDRLERVLRRALESSDLAMAIGGDGIGLTEALFQQARTVLETHDAVLGPSEDGGYYLVGLRRCPQGLFRGIRWSTDGALADTMDQFRRMDLRYACIAQRFDVDRPEDVDRVHHLVKSGRIWSPHVARTLGDRPVG